MRSFVTSYAGLFGRVDAGSPIESIEIPLIQRDYAQGRESATVARIRSGFLSVLHRALTTGEPLHLDFVYGHVDDGGVLRPLDGQQRLTTLFLLHWYLAHRAGRLDDEGGWKRFGYAVRPTARLFCERLVACRPPPGAHCISAWIEDQPWHLHTWHRDPTIQAMLVMLDAIHGCFRDDDCVAAWERLVDPEVPAITFHFLPVEEGDSGEELYIRMNSRGKLLTAFENFKAHFEKTVGRAHPTRIKELALKIDGAWSDILWPYRGDDHIIDDEFLRYLHFVADVCEWRAGRTPEGDVETLAEAVFGRADASAELDFLFAAFDSWNGVRVEEVFTNVFAEEPTPDRLVLFGLKNGDSVDLFGQCCRHYGHLIGKKYEFTLASTLLLYGVLLHRIERTEELARRVRVLRNLIEASGNEIRVARMPEHVADVARLIRDGRLEDVKRFNQAQVADEQRKAALIAAHPQLEPALHSLEDHPVLRGNLAAFELDDQVFERRAQAFEAAFRREHWPALTGALLAQGDYSRQLGWNRFRFGSREQRLAWSDALAGSDRTQLRRAREALGSLLDRLAGVEDVAAALEEIRCDWLAEVEKRGQLDWRYYVVKYPVMREGDSGIYVSEEGMLGYRLCMLRVTYLNGYYRDPYLLAVHRESGVGEAVEDAWFMGYPDRPRWMALARSGIALRCVAEGFVLRPPPLQEHLGPFRRVSSEHGVGEDLVLRIPQVETARGRVDVEDRIQACARLVRALVAAGL